MTINAIAHITGGGLLENIPRVLPANTQADINTSSWKMPAIFDWLQQQGNVEQEEMYRTFNCGIGMLIFVDSSKSDDVLSALQNGPEPDAWIAGKLTNRNADSAVVLDQSDSWLR